MNILYIGLNKKIELPPRSFLFIDDEVPDIPRARVFDPKIHSFNPLKDLDYKRARELADVLYTVYPQGEHTLKVRDGKRALLPALLTTTRLNKLAGHEEVDALRDDLLASPILGKVFCTLTDVPFRTTPRSTILARINRAELGEFDALVLGLFLINNFKGQIIIPDFGFYGRDAHINLIRENRLIAGINYFAELPLRLRTAAMLIPEKIPGAALYDDAALLAKFAGHRPDPSRADNDYEKYIRDAMA